MQLLTHAQDSDFNDLSWGAPDAICTQPRARTQGKASDKSCLEMHGPADTADHQGFTFFLLQKPNAS